MIATQEKVDPHKIGTIFWILFSINYTVMGLARYVSIPMPLSLFVELFYFATIIHVISSSDSYGGTLAKAFGPIFGIYSVWLLYSIAEIANNSAEIEYNTILYRWFAEVRTMALQIVYGFIIFAAIFNSKEKVRKFHHFWGFWILIATAKCMMQQYIGFDSKEQAFFASVIRTHFVSGIIRYFSIFSDAANFGSNMAATTVVFAALTFSAKRRKDKIFFGVCAMAALYGMMASGTRSAIIALAVGLACYAVLSKNIKAIVSTGVMGALTVGMLMFTNIGQGNNQIRRMRSAFNKDDASLAVREANKLAMERYLAEVPMGIGAGITNQDVPPSNKNHFLSTIPPDSTWVYVSIHYGAIGKACFYISFFGIIILGGLKVLSRLKDDEVTGQMAATVSGCAAMFLAGYSNQIMLQYPNCLLFFGAMGMLTVAEITDKRAIEEQEEETRRMLEEETSASEEKSRLLT